MIVVQRAWCGLERTSATMPPEAAATMGATMGRSQAAVMVGRAVSWKYMLEVDGQVKVWGTMAGRIIHYEGEIETGKEGYDNVHPP